MAEAIGTILVILFITVWVIKIIRFFIVGVKVAENVVYKVTDPKDTLKKVERDAKRESKYVNINKEEYVDMQKFGICFSRFAMMVALADGNLEESEISKILDFFSEASIEYRQRIDESMYRDLKDPSRVDFDYTLETMKELFRKKIFLNYDSVLFSLLFDVAEADGEIDKDEIKIIYGIMSKFGWTEEKFSSFYFYRYKNVYDNNNQNISNKKKQYLDILGLPKNATYTEIKARYLSLVKEHHPDKVAYMGEKIYAAAEEKLKMINVAYSGLKDLKAV